MAAAFARRMAGSALEIISGGTRPARAIYPAVAEAMKEVGFDIAGIKPRLITPSELVDCDYAITMGCSSDEVCPVTFRGDARDWDLPDPRGKSLPEVRRIRDDIEKKVEMLIREIGNR
jgi:protein-tyrosine-phosphatase